MPDSPPEIWLGRHGETAWTISRQHTGSTDIPLTDRGREEAQLLAESFGSVDFDLVLSSPLTRAAETARLAGLEPRLDERLVEWDYGEYEGRTTAEIRRERPGWDLWRDGCPGGEAVADIAARLQPLLDELRGRSGQRIAIFGHGHCLRVLAASWVGLGPAAGRALLLGTASLSVLGSEHDAPVIASWNRVHS